MSKRPWYLKSDPTVIKTLTGDAAIDDHLWRSDIQVRFWSNWEGFTIEISSNGSERDLDVAWDEWDAIKRLLRAMEKREREDELRRKRNA